MTDKQKLQNFLSASGVPDTDFQNYIVSEGQFKDKVNRMADSDIKKVLDLPDNASQTKINEGRNQLKGMYNRFDSVDEITSTNEDEAFETDSNNQLDGEIMDGLDELDADNDDNFENAINDAINNADNEVSGDDMFGDSPTSQDNDGEDGEGQEGEGQDGEGQDGEGQEGEGQDGEGQDGEGQEGEGQDGEGQDGEGKDGEGQDGEGKDGEGQDGEGQEGEGQDGEGQDGEGEDGDDGDSDDSDGEGEGDGDNQNQQDDDDSLERQIAILKSQRDRLNAKNIHKYYVEFLQYQINRMEKAITNGDESKDVQYPSFFGKLAEKVIPIFIKDAEEDTPKVAKRNKLIIERLRENIIKSLWIRLKDKLPSLYLTSKDISKIRVDKDRVILSFDLEKTEQLEDNTLTAFENIDADASGHEFLKKMNLIQLTLEKQAVQKREKMLERHVEDKLANRVIIQKDFKENDTNFNINEVFDQPELILPSYE